MVIRANHGDYVSGTASYRIGELRLLAESSRLGIQWQFETTLILVRLTLYTSYHRESTDLREPAAPIIA